MPWSRAKPSDFATTTSPEERFVVDEYQDLGLALHRIVLTMIDKGGVNVFAVGDPDQSIYGFAGARPEFLHEFKSRGDVRAIRLQLNYRCRQKIIDASLHALQPDEVRGFQAALPGDGTEEVVFHKCPNGLAEQASETVTRVNELLVSGVALGEIGILATRWLDLSEFEKQFDAAGIPYRIARTRAYKATRLTTWVEDVAAWCSSGSVQPRPRLAELFMAWHRINAACRDHPQGDRTLRDTIALYEILQPLREPDMALGRWLRALDAGLGLSQLASDWLRHPIGMRHDLRELGAMLRVLGGSEQSVGEFSGVAKDKVVLQSIHGSKGLEYTAVFIPALEKGVLPRYREDPREARRLFYVAITRARQEVHLLWSGHWYTAEGKLRRDGPSPLLAELSKRLGLA